MPAGARVADLVEHELHPTAPVRLCVRHALLERRALLPQTAAELLTLGLSPREVALDCGFNVGPTTAALAEIAPARVFISGRQQPGSRRTQRRLQRYRTGAEGRISHLKRAYGLRRSRLKGDEGQRTWSGWSAPTFNLDTYTRLT